MQEKKYVASSAQQVDRILGIWNEHLEVAKTLPTLEIENGVGILNAAVATGAVSSTSEARRQIKSGGIRLNGAVVVDEKMTLTHSNATPEGVHILSFGKKRHFQLKRK